MKIIIIAFVLLNLNFCGSKMTDVDQVFEASKAHYTNMLESIKGTEKLPRSVDENGGLVLVGPYDWTSGFFPGSLWYLYEYSKEEKWKKAAEKYTGLLEEVQYFTGNHDIGFMMYCSYGNGYRLTKNEKYRKILLQSARSLCTRFNSTVGCIRSWDWNADEWQFPVIIDNMMNLELLMWAFQETGDSLFYNVAVTHANTTMKHHFRDDMSTWHLVDYDTLTGESRIKQTWQGLSDESAWARGQAWGLYGYTMMYREAGVVKYLDLAEKIAQYFMTHSNLPEDKVPFWDFDVQNENEPRDASAAAIVASALIDLSKFSYNKQGQYKQFANEILESLSSRKYLAELRTNNNFILKHSVGAKPENKEVDVPLNYADYYFLEALIKKAE